MPARARRQVEFPRSSRSASHRASAVAEPGAPNPAVAVRDLSRTRARMRSPGGWPATPRPPYAYVQNGPALPRRRAASPTTRIRRPARYPLETLPVQDQARLLPAVRRRDGAAAADGRRPGAGRRRVHDRHLRHARPTSGWSPDIDAHAWVEAWFPSYGWVRFDPTPGERARARRPTSGRRIERLGERLRRREAGLARPRARHRRGRRTGGRGATHGAGERPGGVLAIVAGLAVLALLAAVRLVTRPRAGTPTTLLAELERALARTGRPMRRGTHAGRARAPLRAAPEAAATSARSGSRATAVPRRAADARRQRRALRAQLRMGLGRSAGVCARCGRCRRGRLPAPPAGGRGGLNSIAMDDVYDLFRRGTELLEAGHHHQAVIPLSRARDLAPDKTSIREALGRALFHTQRYEQAAAEFEAVIERAPTNDFALFCLGRCLQLLGRHAEARKPLALAACLQPGRRDYRVYRDRARARAAAAVVELPSSGARRARQRSRCAAHALRPRARSRRYAVLP